MASVPAWPVLNTGDTGVNVKALQCLLVFRGYDITVDGDFGPATKSAVVGFQGRKGLTTDGNAGPSTLSAIVDTVSSGESNYSAKGAQYLLSKFETITVDGKFGTNSVATAKTFQTKMGLTVDGVVGPITWHFLFGYSDYPASVDNGNSGSDGLYCSNSALTSAQMKVNAQYILNYLRARGWTKNAVCGLLGNMQKESTINPGRWQSGKENNMRVGFGLVQWTPASKYFNWADDQNLTSIAMDSELKRIIYELSNHIQYYATSSYDLTFSEFSKSTKSADYLARAFVHNYERPASYDGEDARADAATAWYSSLS